VSRRVLIAILVALCGCTDPEPPPVDEGPPELDDGWIRFETPPLFIPAGSEKLFCYFTTFEVTGGIHDAIHRTDSPLLHLDHIVGKTAPQYVEVEDEEVVDCTELGAWWGASAPLYEPGEKDEDLIGLGLPDGIAFPIAEGQRFLVDSHFINATEEDAWATVWVDLLIIDDADVLSPAGAISFDLGNLRVPPGEHTEVFDCEWQGDATILSVGPHMHERGASFELDWIAGDGSGDTIKLIDIQEWQRTFEEFPPELDYEPSSLTVRAGDVFRTTCRWNNDSGHDLVFPEEMCTTLGVGYPLPRGASCAGGLVVDGSADPLAGQGAKVSGSITSTVDFAGVGDVWLLLFEDRPGSGGSLPIQQVQVPAADLSAGGSVDYEIVGVGERSDPWFLWAVYDTDQNWKNSFSPNSGDGEIVSPTGDTAVEFLVESLDPIALDLQFNSIVP